MTNKRLRGALLLILMLCLSLFAGALAENADTAATGETSKSKSATNLDSNYETTVTLSFPSAQVSLDSDVVFVLDKSTSADVEDAALAMLKDLQGQLTDTGAKINVAVVIFNKEAHSSGWLDLATQYSAIETAFKQDISSGTNSHAGLLAAQKLLSEHTNIANDRKYLIFVSDGITYIFNEEPTSVAWNCSVDHVVGLWVGPDCWKNKYGTNNPPTNWDAWLNDIGTKIAKQGTTYDYPYGGEHPNETDAADYQNYANSVDKALYLTAQVYKECLGAGYRCYALAATQNGGESFVWGPSFMSYLAGISKKEVINEAEGEEDGDVEGESKEEIVVDFSYIGDDILYMLGDGSHILDYIGCTDDYDFDLVEGSLKVKVGANEYELIKNANYYDSTTGEYVGTQYISKATDDDGNSLYRVSYYPFASIFSPNGESICFDINTNVTNFQRVELSYKLKLKNPKTAAGTYGQYDQYGEKGYKALYTNNSATLYPVDSYGNKGEAENFNKPTVSYTVYAPTETTPPSGDIDVPKTGDSTPLALLAALTALSAAGVMVILKRQRAHR